MPNFSYRRRLDICQGCADLHIREGNPDGMIYRCFKDTVVWYGTKSAYEEQWLPWGCCREMEYVVLCQQTK